MGVLNATPDSFFKDGGRYFVPATRFHEAWNWRSRERIFSTLAASRLVLRSGVLSAAEEIRRVVPVIEAYANG